MNWDNSEPITIGPNRSQVAFLVECRSLSGFSGSPAFVYPDELWRPARSVERAAARSQFADPKLLGVDCAHFQHWSPVCEEKDRATALKDRWVDTNSGVAVVIPAWHLRRILEQEHLVNQRKERDEEIVKRRAADGADTSAI